MSVYNDICGVYSLTFLVRIAAGLDTTFHGNFGTFLKILLYELCSPAETYTSDEVSGGLVIICVTANISVHCQCISGIGNSSVL